MTFKVKMKLITALCTIIICTFSVSSVKLPSNFKKCYRKQPNFNGCLLEAARHGITQMRQPYRELKMFSLEPLEIIEASKELRSNLVNMDHVFRNCKLYGLTYVKFDRFEINFDQKTMDVGGTWPEIKGICNYFMNGTIMLIPIRGEGISTTTFKNQNLNFHMNYEEVRRRNKTYVKEIYSSLDGRPELITFNLENLSNGDRESGYRVNKLLNDNWSELYDDVRSVYLEDAKYILIKAMNGWFKRVSLEESFD